jgi:hypothetical protein
MSEKIGDVPESKQNRENEKIFFLSFLYKEAAKKIFFFVHSFIKEKRKQKKQISPAQPPPEAGPPYKGVKYS